MKRRMFTAVAVVSLLLCVAVITEEALRFPDNDFSVYASTDRCPECGTPQIRVNA